MSKRICIFGDSIVYGYDDFAKGGWANRLKFYLWAEKLDYSVYNQGISGDSTVGILKRLDIECAARSPEMLIFSIGINDSALFSGASYVPLEMYKNNLDEILKIARKYTDKIIFLGLSGIIEDKVTPTPWDKNIFYWQEEKDKYNKVLQDFVSKNNLNFISLDGLLGEEDLPDGLHPNEVGHKKIFEKVKNYLVENNFLVKT
jgi:lysophospholipase L1-like esterase